MDERPVETSSSTSLRWLSPPHICVPYREAFSPWGDAESRLHRRLAFVERCLQVFVAYLACERRAQGAEAPNALRALLQKFDRPGMGDWLRVVRELAAQSGGVAPELERALDEEALWAAGRLVEQRNAFMHHREQFASIAEEVQRPMAVFLRAADALARRPVLVITDLEGEGALRRARVLRFRGPEPEELVVDDVDCQLPIRRPLLVGDDGRVVSLSPWLTLGQAGSRPELRLLTRRERSGRGVWEGYEVGSGVAAAALDPEAVTQFTALQAAFTASQAALLNQRSSARDPERVGPYRIVRRLGSGGSGRLYLATLGPNGAEHAIKVLHPDLLGDQTARQRLEKEYRLLRTLERPDIVRVTELGEDPAHGAWIAMELIQGQDLSGQLGRCDAAEAVRLVEAVLRALESLHDRGVVHRDIKPSNVLLRDDGSPVLIDLGVALGVGPALTRTGELVGTDRYAAPEQRGGHAVDDRADLYAVGRLLAALVAGDPDAPDLASKLPPPLLAFWRRAVEAEPARRFNSAEEMRKALGLARQASGPPAHIGQVIDSVRVQRAPEEVAPGIWAVVGVNVLNDVPAGLLVAAPGGSAAALAAAARARPELGLAVDATGLYVLRVPASDPVRVARELLGTGAPDAPAQPPLAAEPPPPKAAEPPPKAAEPPPKAAEPPPKAAEPPPKAAEPPPPPAAQTPPPASKSPSPPPGGSAGAAEKSSSDWKTAAAALGGVLGAIGLGAMAAKASAGPVQRVPLRAPYLVGIPGPMKTTDPDVLLASVHLLGLVLIAQGVATGELDVSEERWLDLEKQPLLAAARVLGLQAGKGPLHEALARMPTRDVLLSVLKRAVDARAQKHPLSPGELLATQKLARILGDAAVQIGPSAPVERLSPFLRPIDGGQWQYLATRRRQRAYVLLKPAFAFGG